MITYACMVLLGSSVGFALNLPGIAGAIVAIGVTADSFVIYFERIRDEVRDGRSLRTAVETGWQRAKQTILIADAVSMLSAVILFILAIGSVKGFAFTLGLTTVIDVLVVFMFTKPLMTLLARTKFFGGGHRLSGLDPGHLGVQGSARCSGPAALGRHDGRGQQREGRLMSRFSSLTHRLYTGEISYDFIGRRRRWYLLSAILLTVSLLALLVRGLDFGIEFEGGADFRAPTQVNAQTVDDMRAALEETGLPDLDDATITTIGDDQVRVQTRPLDPTTEVPVVRRSDRRRGRHPDRRGGVQPDRRVLGYADHPTGADRPGGVPGPGRAGDLGVLPRTARCPRRL